MVDVVTRTLTSINGLINVVMHTLTRLRNPIHNYISSETIYKINRTEINGMHYQSIDTHKRSFSPLFVFVSNLASHAINLVK